jgi:hypothetical protein
MTKFIKSIAQVSLALAYTATHAGTIGTLYDGKSGTTDKGEKYIFFSKDRGAVFASPGNTKEITTNELIQGRYDDRMYNGQLTQCTRHIDVQKCEVKHSEARTVSHAVAAGADVSIGVAQVADFGFNGTYTKTISNTVEDSATIHVNSGTEVQFYIYIPRGTKVTRTLKGAWDDSGVFTQSGKKYYMYVWKPNHVLMKLVTEERALYIEPVWTFSVKRI